MSCTLLRCLHPALWPGRRPVRVASRDSPCLLGSRGVLPAGGRGGDIQGLFLGQPLCRVWEVSHGHQTSAPGSRQTWVLGPAPLLAPAHLEGDDPHGDRVPGVAGCPGFLQPRLVSVTGVLKSHAVTQLEVALILCRTCPPPPSCDRQVSAPEPGLGCAWWTGLSGRTREAGCPAGRAPPSPGASAVTVISGAAAGPSVLPGSSRGLASHTLLLPPPFLPH